MTEERYYIFETQKSSENGLTLLMDGEPVLAENREQAVKQFIREDGDLNPSEISKAEIMEEQHYLAIPVDEVRESFYGHSDKRPVHEILGM